MKKLMWIAILVGAVVLLGATNPGYDTHKKAIADWLVAKSEVQQPLAKKGVAAIGSVFAGAVTEYKSYGLFSVTKNERGWVTFGVLGFVLPLEQKEPQ
ncbi:hypothetical protein GX586_02560 [bacterium]|nr:hypothetical protein [bacterium]